VSVCVVPHRNDSEHAAFVKNCKRIKATVCFKHCSTDLAPSTCLYSGMCVSWLLKHYIYIRPHQNASEHAESVNNCKQLKATGFTFVNGSGFKKVLMSWHVCCGLPKHVMCVRPHQNDSEHAEPVKKCKNLKDIVFFYIFQWIWFRVCASVVGCVSPGSRRMKSIPGHTRVLQSMQRV